MLESFLKFLELGLFHIVSFSSYDHILFVVLLALPYVFKDWKRLLILISVFTLGHTLSLLLGVYDIVNLNVNITEWLIPMTIFFAALYNIFSPLKPTESRSYLMLGVVVFFGLIHGLGFANAFKTLVSSNENTFLSIMEFAIGIEIGQLVVVFCVLFLSFIFQNIFRFNSRDWVMVSSAIILGLMLPLIIQSPLFS
jgi:ABC-type antimicrobial peptide transport system permease subunit